MPGQAETRIKSIPVKSLRLDPANPRLPLGMDGSVSETVVKYYWDNYVLDELIDSYRASGYFEQEPMIVQPEGDEYIVLEGNRRLAALIQLLRLPGFVPGLDVDEPSDELRSKLKKIPCLVADSREEVASHLGFRHIGGIRPWPPEAKARFVAGELRRFVDEGGEGNPFAQIARMIGTNAQSVRLSFYALELLLYARRDLGIDVTYVANYRFGVWLRCMSAKGIVERLGIEIPRDFEKFSAAIEAVDRRWLNVLIQDLTGKDDQPAVLADSRDVTVYGYVLADDRAYKILRETKDLRVAEQMVSGTALAVKIDAVARRVTALVVEAERLDEFDDLALESARTLAAKAKTLVNALRSDEDD